MGIYLFAFLYLLLFSALEMTRKRIKPEKAKTIAFIFGVVLLIYIAGFRYGLETDYWVYYREFNGESTRKLEFSFNLLMQIVKLFTDNYNVFLIIFSVITLSLKSRIFSRYNFCFTVLLIYYVRFFVQFDLNTIRQGLAIAIVFYALEELKKDKLKPFFIIIVIAATIHTSALILLILPLFRKMNLSMTKIIIGFGLAALFRIVFLDKIILLFKQYLPFVFSSNSSVISNLQYILNNDTSIQFELLSYIRIIVPTICLFYLTKGTKNELFFKTYFIGSVLNIALFGLDTVGFRLAAYFMSAEVLIMGDIYNNVVSSSINETRIDLKKIIAFSAIVFCDMWTFFSLLGSSETLVPFRTFFEQL